MQCEWHAHACTCCPLSSLPASQLGSSDDDSDDDSDEFLLAPSLFKIRMGAKDSCCDESETQTANCSISSLPHPMVPAAAGGRHSCSAAAAAAAAATTAAATAAATVATTAATIVAGTRTRSSSLLSASAPRHALCVCCRCNLSMLPFCPLYSPCFPVVVAVRSISDATL